MKMLTLVFALLCQSNDLLGITPQYISFGPMNDMLINPPTLKAITSPITPVEKPIIEDVGIFHRGSGGCASGSCSMQQAQVQSQVQLKQQYSSGSYGSGFFGGRGIPIIRRLRHR
jgi:hypothetical protein